MKKNSIWISTIIFFGLLSFEALADDTRTVDRVLKDTTTMISLNLNAETVFCTSRGYGSVQLKVSVPDLTWLAHYDHRVVGERIPCMTGGECSEILQPTGILDANEQFAVVPIRVVLTQHLTIDDQKKTCTQGLSERISSYVRGRSFQHSRGGDVTTLDYESCLKLINL